MQLLHYRPIATGREGFGDDSAGPTVILPDMNKARAYWMVCALVLALLGAARLVHAQLPDRGGYPDPARFEDAIKRFEQADARQMPPRGAVLFTGSSSIRLWHEHLEADMAGLTVVGRGFGGSTMYDLLHYADRVILPYRPRAVVIYEGDNDIHAGISPEKLLETYEALLAVIHAELPDCRVYMLSIKPSHARWALWPKMQQANRMFAERCEKDERLTYVDLATPLLGEDGKPVASLFIDDQLHLSRAGYVVWRDTLAPLLKDAEAGHEPAGE